METWLNSDTTDGWSQLATAVGFSHPGTTAFISLSHTSGRSIWLVLDFSLMLHPQRPQRPQHAHPAFPCPSPLSSPLPVLLLLHLPSAQECPSGVVNEETFKQIYAQFFPHGGTQWVCAVLCCAERVSRATRLTAPLLCHSQMPAPTHTSCSTPLTQDIPAPLSLRFASSFFFFFFFK